MMIMIVRESEPVCSLKSVQEERKESKTTFESLVENFTRT